MVSVESLNEWILLIECIWIAKEMVIQFLKRCLGKRWQNSSDLEYLNSYQRYHPVETVSMVTESEIIRDSIFLAVCCCQVSSQRASCCQWRTSFMVLTLRIKLWWSRLPSKDSWAEWHHSFMIYKIKTMKEHLGAVRKGTMLWSWLWLWMGKFLLSSLWPSHISETQKCELN